MQFVRLGNVSSQAEYQEVLPRLTLNQVFDAAELLAMIADREKGRASPVRRRIAWRDVARDPAIKLFMGEPTGQEGALWAAVVFEASDQVTLLKITDKYFGGERERENLLADALDRFERGVRHG